MCNVCERDDSKLVHRYSRRRAMGFLAAAVVGTGFIDTAWAKEAKVPPKPQNVVSSDHALYLLRKGNERYVDGVSKRHDFRHERGALATGQNPYAGILSCADSRVAPEYAFDSGRGDLFVCRVAGNFANAESIASFEYAVANLNVPLILVLGHEKCGAVEATIKSIEDNSTLPGHLPSLVAALAPAVKESAQQPGDPLANAIRQNVLDTVEALKSARPILQSAVAGGKLKIAGGIYKLSDGEVEILK